MIRKLWAVFLVALTLMLVAAACAPRSVPLAGPTPQATSTSADLPPNSGAASVLEAVPAGPPAMQIGSAYRYFDGSLLDAVPNDGPVMLGGSPNEVRHQVTVSDYWIYSTEVSNQMYAWCVSLGKCSPPDQTDNPNYGKAEFSNFPAVGVTWQQAADYCTFAHGSLPTEAQWEKAASWDAGTKQQRLYPWGSDNPSCDLLNYKYCYRRATSVLQFGQGQSFYGAFNMEGNVAEWVADWFKPGYKDIAQDPQGPAAGSQRSIRGSAYDSDAMYAAPSWRFQASPNAHRPNLGFRCIVKDPAYFAPYCQMPVYYGIDPTLANASNPCPDPTISHQQTCGLDFTVHNFITVEKSGSTLVQITGLASCTPGNNNTGLRHDCVSGVTVKVTASCNVKPVGAVTCPPNYHQDPADPGRCIAPGGPGACPAGFNYDSSMQCCSASTNTTQLTPLCSVGQHMYNGACVDDGSGLWQPHSLSLSTSGAASCIPGLFVPNGGSGTATPTLIPFPTSTPVPPATNTPVPTSTPQPSATPAPTNTPQPTATQPSDTQTSVPPTDTPAPTSPPPTDTPAPPTDTSAPPPTPTQ